MKRFLSILIAALLIGSIGTGAVWLATSMRNPAPAAPSPQQCQRPVVASAVTSARSHTALGTRASASAPARPASPVAVTPLPDCL